MRLELMTIDLSDRSTTSYATEMSKMISNLPTFHWRKTLPRSDIAEQILFIPEFICVVYYIIWLNVYYKVKICNNL